MYHKRTGGISFRKGRIHAFVEVAVVAKHPAARNGYVPATIFRQQRVEIRVIPDRILLQLFKAMYLALLSFAIEHRKYYTTFRRTGVG